MLCLRTLTAAFVVAATVSAQTISEPPDFSDSFPGMGPTIVGRDCVFLAAGTITPGDVDWVRVTLPVSMSQTVVDLDFADGAGAAALFVQVEQGASGFNTGDGNNALDDRCGLGSGSTPVGSTTDAVVNVGATGRGAVLDIGVTGGSDGGFTGAHSEDFVYEVWLHLTPVPCAADTDCGDPHDCTIDTCNTDTGVCSNVADDAICDDGSFCNGEETCDIGTGCLEGEPPTCEDGVGCTDDVCDITTDRCANAPNDAACDNGRFCDGVEACDAVAGCVEGSPPSCDDGIDCTIDRCDSSLDACISEPDNAGCADAFFCNGEETCDAAQGCVAGAPPCGSGLCRESDGACVDCLADADCADSDLCNGTEFCDANGVCQAGDPPCDESQTCDPRTGECRQAHVAALVLDIKPGACPNKLSRNSRGFVSVALVSVGGFDVRAVNAGSIAIRRADGVGGSIDANNGPPGPKVSDVAAPFDGDPCDCHKLESDGTKDLLVRFSVEELLDVLDLSDLPSREPIELVVSGTLTDGSSFELVDCVELSGNARNAPHSADEKANPRPHGARSRLVEPETRP